MTADEMVVRPLGSRVQAREHAFEVKIEPIEPADPARGYRIEIKRDWEVILRTRVDPATGEDLDFDGCVRVAGYYGG